MARALCGAKNRQGQPCKQRVEPGRERCRFHGGRHPRGPASPHYKHGRYSKVGPLAEAAKRVEEQSDLLDLRQGVALFDVRIEEIAERLEEKDTPGLRREAIELLTGGEVDKALELLEKGAERDSAWEKLLTTQERRSDRAEKAQDRWLKQTQVYHVAELQAAVMTMVEVLTQHVPRDVVAKVVQDFDARLLAPAE